MPIYEYRCEKGHTFEVIQKMTDDSLASCQTCEAPVRRVFHPVAVHFKGSGFYNTDYGKGKPSSDESTGAERGESTGADRGASTGADRGASPEKSGTADAKSGGGETKPSGGGDASAGGGSAGSSAASSSD